ncbi:hypothetical protein LRY65_02225 [Candidatus Woesebacteria bacterium]|nr:hypothetical protein [Candidatus Woesebacteria bacterium]MCD8507304.1 hypothetical protein [Candidatus Woesebacteria bacterium]MCD8527009.1 hypothetical protein [Candidatus Woesebacteria bacterium]
MSGAKQPRNWRQVIANVSLIALAAIIAPLSTWWALPVFFWLVGRLLVQRLRGFWLFVLVILVSLQVAVVWSLWVGVSLLGVAGVFWSWEWIIRVRQYVWRWLLEIGHGLVAITVMLGGMSQFSVEKMLLNILILLVGIAVLISIEQRYE